MSLVGSGPRAEAVGIAKKGLGMQVSRHAAVLLTLAGLAGPARALELALAAPTGAAVPPLAFQAPALSAQAEAVRAALEEAQDGGDAIEESVLTGVRNFYELRGFEPVWITHREDSAQMRALQRRMDAAGIYGLDPGPYATPPLAGGDPASIAAADVNFSRAAARFVTHLSSGRRRPADVSPIITLKPERPDAAGILATLSNAASVASALESYEPPHREYFALKAKLAELRAAPEPPPLVVVPDGPLLRPGTSDGRVPLLRARLAIAEQPGVAADIYDDALVFAVEAAQSAAGLKPDGIVGPRTLAALNGVSQEDDIAAIAANMERWRWMPRDLGAFHVIVNVPEFVVRVVDRGEVVHQTRVIVGKPGNPTPTFSHAMSHLVVNPYWNVPTSILRKEMIDDIRRDPYGYFGRHGYQVLAQVGGKMRVVDPGAIDWTYVNPSSVRVRQVPGDDNALGRLKFMFPNQHSVYLHDTPTRSLFEKDHRAFSHGCVRVDEPLAFADAILPVAAPEWSSARIERLYGGRERRINLDRPVPVHLAYFTRAVAEDETLLRFDDIYGYDAEMKDLLGF
jgi:murein L,D-transpeptidase YcbB/YkuD